MKMLQFAFVNIDGSSGKPRATNGKTLVRSHCMRGKNKREDSRRSVRQARQFKHVCVTNSETAVCSCGGGGGGGARLDSTASTDHETTTTTTAIYEIALSSPHASPPDLSLVSLAGDVNRHSQKLLFKCECMR